MSMESRSCGVCVGGVICAAGALFACPSPAQERTELESVTVWALKRPEPLQTVPLSVSTLTGEQLASAGVGDLQGVAELTPSFDMQRSVSAVTTTLRIRRVGNLGNIPTFEPAVGLFVDGALRSRSLLGIADLLDVERVEVLNGPQGGLYGKNVSAGVVAIYTRPPGATATGYAEASAGSIDSPRSASLGTLRVAASGPLTRTLGAGFGAAWSTHEHTLVNALPDGRDGNDQSRTSVRGQLSWQPHDRLDVRLIAGHVREHDDQGESDVYLVPGARSTAIAAALQQIGGLPCATNAPHDRTTCSVATNRLELDASDVTLTGQYRLGNGWQLASTTGWDRYTDRRDEDDLVQLYTPLLFFHDSEQGTTLQQELRLESADGARVHWLAGVFYYRNDYRRGSDGERPMFGPNGPAAFSALWPTVLGGLPLALPGQEGTMDSRLITDYYSAFGHITLPLTARLSVAAALRWQAEDKRGSIDNAVTLPGASVISRVLTPSTAPGGAPINGDMRRSTDYVTWSITPQFQFNERTMSYLTVARGGKSGGFNPGFGNAPLSAREFEDESIDHYELGARVTLMNERMHLSTAAFLTRYRDYQDAAFISSQFTVGNVDRAELRGMEFDARALLGPHTVAHLGISLADLTYREHTTGMCYPGRVPDGSLPNSCDLSGEHPVDAPEWEIAAGLEHTLPTHWGRWFGRLDWSWTDEYNTSFSADPRLVQNDHHNIALRLGAGIGDLIDVTLWGENLLDEQVVYFDSVLNLFNDASYQSFLAEPRTWGVTVRARF